MSRTVGVVADNASSLVRLRAIVSGWGETVAYGLTAEQMWKSPPLNPSLWIVVSERADDIFDVLSDWSDAPVLLADDFPSEDPPVYFQQWCSSLSSKVAKTMASLGEDEAPAPRKTLRDPEYQFKDVWVLAASLGGPEAVRVFLSEVNPELPIAFVYAQHIEPSFDKMLPSVVGKKSRVQVNFSSDGEMLRKGTVMVFPSHTFASVDGRGRIWVTEGKEWNKPYTPNIDQIIRNVADYYQGNMGIIIFSGMCDDGAAASAELSGKGVPLWAQRPEDCICPAMPEAVIRRNAASFIGTSEELARHLNNRYGKVNARG